MAAQNEEPFSLYYHPIPFRGRFVTSILCYTNTSFKLMTSAELNVVKESPEVMVDFFAPPVLYDRVDDLYLGQMPAIVFHLGLKLNLMPPGPKQSQAIKVVLDCNDVLCEITRNNGHQMWDREAWKEFVSEQGRFVKWLNIFDKGGMKNNLKIDGGWFLGTDEPTIADLAIWSLFTTMEKSLPKLSNFLRSHAPLTLSLCDRLTAQSTPLKELLDGTGTLYCGGFIEKSIRAMLEDEEAK
jgi:glutathione S-transferase